MVGTVLFGTAINKMVTDEGTNGIVFLEIAPHPVLKAYVEKCSSESISLVHHPNPNVPAWNTNEHYQFLEGIGNLLGSGFKNTDFNKLRASPDGTADFTKAKLPEYLYNKSHCWAKYLHNLSCRLQEKPRPVASSVMTMTFCNPHQCIPESSASFPSPHAQSRNLTLIPDSERPFLITLNHSQPDRLYLSLISSSSLSLASSHTLPLPLSHSLRLTLLVLRLHQPYTT